jgi:hypothetical protein
MEVRFSSERNDGDALCSMKLFARGFLMSLTGSFATNPHEGSRSEYLAHYVFSGLGTSIPVPHQEDTGLDLYCTLVEKIGRRSWPRQYYAVQVKSTSDPWELADAESVRWLVEFPLPIFLCVVDKKSARLRVYQTSPRFYAWAHPPLPERLELVPGDGDEGRFSGWEGGTTFSLSAPILSFTVMDALEDPFRETTMQILGYWSGVDEFNLYQLRTGVRRFNIPAAYKTNEVPGGKGICSWGVGKADPEMLQSAVEGIKNQLAWITGQLHQGGDLYGSLLGALLLRHLKPDDLTNCMYISGLLVQVSLTLGVGQGQYIYAGLDEIARAIKSTFPGDNPKPAPTAFHFPASPPGS